MNYLLDKKLLITSLITPFDETSNVDVDELTDLIKHIKLHSSDGIIVGGITGEGHSLSLEELLIISEVACQFKSNKFKVFVYLTSNDTNTLITQIATFDKLLVDAFIVPVPYFIQPNQSGLVTHFLKLTKSNKKILIHSSPARTGCSIDFASLNKLAKNNKIIGIINDSNDVKLVQKIKELHPKFLYFVGNERYLFASLKYGINGVVSSASHLIGDDIKEALNDADDDIDNRGLIEFICLIIDVIHLESPAVTIKYFLSFSGFSSTHLRLPLLTLFGENKRKIDLFIN